MAILSVISGGRSEEILRSACGYFGSGNQVTALVTADALPEDLIETATADGWKSVGSRTSRKDRPSVWLYRGRSRLNITLASRWVGGAQVTPGEAQEVLNTLDLVVRMGLNVGLQHTPGATGLEALKLRWDRAGWDIGPFPQHLRGIAKAFGQGRVECCPVVDPVPAIVQMDISLAYLRMACHVSWADGWELVEGGKHMPGALWPSLVEAEVTVPDGWGHVGLIAGEGPGGWRYPTSGRFLGRVTPWEAFAATEQGWKMRPVRSIVPRGPKKIEPLRTWAEKIIAIVENSPFADASRHSAQQFLAYRNAARAIGLHAIGMLNAGDRTETVRVGSLEAVESSTIAMETLSEIEETGEWEYDREAVRSSGKHEWARHPEMAALVYGAARASLLSYGKISAKTGALHVPREQIVGFGTDCVYTTEPWGEGSVWRVKGTSVGPFAAPATMADIWRITKEAEG